MYTELKRQLDTAIANLNALMLEDDASAKDKDALLETVAKLTKDTNAAWKAEQMAALRKQDNPMREALVKANLELHKVKLDKTLNVYSIEDAVRRIDLIEFDKFCCGCAADVRWKGKLANFARLLTAFVGEELGKSKEEIQDILDNYKLISDVVRTEKPTLLSNRNMVSELQAVLDMVYFEDNGDGKNSIKITNKDVNFMKNAFTRQARTTGTIKAGTPTNMADIVLQMLHMRLLNLPYGLEYRSNK